MTQEDKELLIKDLCARLPYGVKARIIVSNKPLKWYDTIVDGRYIDSLSDEGESAIKDIKPYLFSMSSMTEEQKAEITETIVTVDEDCNIIADEDILNVPVFSEPIKYEDASKYFDWLNEHHFDYRGLIDKGLAIDATNLNIY